MSDINWQHAVYGTIYEPYYYETCILRAEWQQDDIRVTASIFYAVDARNDITNPTSWFRWASTDQDSNAEDYAEGQEAFLEDAKAEAEKAMHAHMARNLQEPTNDDR